MTKETSRCKRDHQYCRALLWIAVGLKRVPILPVSSLAGLGILLFSLLCGLGLAELVIKAKGGKEILSHESAQAWERENAIINANNRGKISQRPVWNSVGHPYREPRQGGRRILVLGDSFAWGDGNANMNYIWWRQLEWSLHRRGYWNVDVVSCGGLGGNTEHELKLLRDEKLADRVKADLVIIGYVTNDAVIGSNRVSQLSGPRLAAMTKKYRSSTLDLMLKPLMPNVSELLQERLVDKTFFRQPSKPGVGYPYSVWEMKLLDGPNWSMYRKVVFELGAFIARSDQPVLMITLPNYPNWKQFSTRYRKLIPLCRKAGIPFYNTLKAFVTKHPIVADQKRWFVNPANGHPGPRSTHFYAEQAADILERDYAEYLGEKVAQPALEPNINDWSPFNLKVQRKESEGYQWDVTFSREQMYLMTLPVGKPHIMFAFEMPVAARQVRFSGDALTGAELYVNAIDPEEGCDMGVLHEAGARRGNSLSWDLSAEQNPRRVTMLRIALAVDAKLYQEGRQTFTLSVDFNEPSICL